MNHHITFLRTAASIQLEIRACDSAYRSKSLQTRPSLPSFVTPALRRDPFAARFLSFVDRSIVLFLRPAHRVAPQVMAEELRAPTDPTEPTRITVSGEVQQNCENGVTCPILVGWGSSDVENRPELIAS